MRHTEVQKFLYVDNLTEILPWGLQDASVLLRQEAFFLMVHSLRSCAYTIDTTDRPVRLGEELFL
jgi:hypothetical protein